MFFVGILHFILFSNIKALTVFATAFARNYIEMLILRTLYGVVIGLSIPIS
jgi:hypothetical protein